MILNKVSLYHESISLTDMALDRGGQNTPIWPPLSLKSSELTAYVPARKANSSPKMKKFRQKFFESIQSDWAKKMKALPNTFWGDFRNKHVLQTCEQKRFPFFWGNSNLFKNYFLLGNLFPQNDRKSFFDTKLEANFSPKVTIRYVSKWRSYKSGSSWLLYETYCTKVNLYNKEDFSTNKQETITVNKKVFSLLCCGLNEDRTFFQGSSWQLSSTKTQATTEPTIQISTFLCFAD